jgi:hypothetical protein
LSRETNDAFYIGGQWPLPLPELLLSRHNGLELIKN